MRVGVLTAQLNDKSPVHIVSAITNPPMGLNEHVSHDEATYFTERAKKLITDFCVPYPNYRTAQWILTTVDDARPAHHQVAIKRVIKPD